MNIEQKKSFIRKLLISAGVVFETIAGASNKIGVSISTLRSQMTTRAYSIYAEANADIKAYTDKIRNEITALTVTVDGKLTTAESHMVSNEIEIVNIQKLGTDVGTYTTWNGLTHAPDAGLGDTAELSVRDGDKPPGLYRHNGNGFNTTPYINYEESRSVDEPISQAEVDAIVGV